ncbi:MAG: right-handed parallel beta-helix repeat-containing protein, partial [Candidatus Omnitrophica bacterium]|nr:right-handed parallel beta-helix repeat-containing protein [Candidatus Omnitrophota bacterium]
YLFLNQSSKSVDIDFSKSQDLRIKKVNASLIGLDGTKEVPLHFTLVPMAKKEFIKTTNLWIDNFIPLFNGTAADKDSNVALVDLYFSITNLNKERSFSSIGLEDEISSFHPAYLYNSISCKDITPPTVIYNDSFEEWVDSPDGYFLPKGFMYFQEGSGGVVEKCISKENIKDKRASILLKPSSRGASYVRYQLPDIEKLRGRTVKFSIWVKSSNKSFDAIQIDVQDGVEAPLVASYPNSGGWELLEVEKYVSKNAKFILLTYNIKDNANSPAYFDNSIMIYSDDQFKIKIHEPYNVPALFHDSLGEGKIDRTIVKIKNGKDRQKEIIYFKDNICNDILTVKENQTLVLEPGQIIRFSENAGIVVYGKIFAKGKKDKKIELLPQNDKWLGLLVINNNETDKVNYLSNCRIVAASELKAKFYNPSGGLSFIKTSIILKDIDIEGFSSEDSVHFYKSNFKVSGLSLTGGAGDGIDSDWSYGTITKSYFSACGGDCMDVSGSLAEISYNNIVKSKDKGISVGEGSMVFINNNELDENAIGIAIKDQSIAAGEGNVFRKNTTAAIALYIKKANYIQPRAVLSGSEFYENKSDILNVDFNKVTREYDK